MEPVSLAFGVVALASLFSTCVECFEYISTAKSFPNDLELVLVKFDVQKERLLTWGELVGISKPNEGGRHRNLDQKETLVKRCLSSVQQLFRDASELERRYGLRLGPAKPSDENLNGLSSNRTSLFKRSSKRVTGMPNLQRSGLQQKARWVIHDKSKFEVLVAHVRDLVDNLHDLVPIHAPDQNALVCKDISTLDISKLRVVKDACAGTYQAWSDVASVMITASESETVDHRSIGDWIQDTTQKRVGNNQVTSNTDMTQRLKNVPKALEMLLPETTCIYFVFTGTCFLLGSDNPCSPATVGFLTFKTEGHSFLPGLEDMALTKWSLGRRISESMQLSFKPDDVEMLRYANFELREIQSEVMSKLLPLGTMYVYCGPCICALRTALVTCMAEQCKTLHCLVRVDDRIDTSCCQQRSRLDYLTSIMDAIKTIEAMPRADTDDVLDEWTQIVDRIWLEQRIYALEEELYGMDSSKTGYERGTELFAELRSDGTGKTAFVILGELERCQWMLQTSPFPWRPRMPKATEIYQLKGTGEPRITRWTRTFLGTFTPRLYHVKSDLQNESRADLTSSELHAQMLPSTLAHIPIQGDPLYLESGEDVSDADTHNEEEEDELRLPQTFVFRGRKPDGNTG